MRLDTVRIKAKDLPCDVFLFLPEQNRFFFVDDLEVHEKSTILFFEPEADPDTWQSLKVPNDQEFDVVAKYEVNSGNLFS